MSEALKKSEVPTAKQPRWSPLHNGLAFLAAAEPFATPVYAAMASAAALAALVLGYAVNESVLIFALPFSIVAAAIVAGTVTKSWMNRPQKRGRRRRRRR